MTAPPTAPPAVAHYRLRDLAVRVTAEDAAIVRALDRLCSQFASEPNGTTLALEVRRATDGGWDILGDGSVVAHRSTVLGAARHVEWRMVGRAARQERALVHLHAAALTRGGRTLLLAGPPQGGKSTLALALTACGFELLGEDLVFMHPRTGEIHPFPRAPHVRDGAFSLLRSAGVYIPAACEQDGVVASSQLHCWRTTPSPPLTHVVFTRWQRNVEGAVARELTAAEAAIRLRESSHNLNLWPEHGWPLLQRRLDGVPCLQLACGPDLLAAATALVAAIEAPPAPGT